MPAKRKNKQASEKAPLHRTGATERHYVPGYPKKLYIYKLKASKFWWARYFANGNAVRKSTKTENKRLAIAFAKQFYDEITMGARAGQGAALAATSFDVCLKQMLEADKAAFDRGDTKLRSLRRFSTSYCISCGRPQAFVLFSICWDVCQQVTVLISDFYL